MPLRQIVCWLSVSTAVLSGPSLASKQNTGFGNYAKFQSWVFRKIAEGGDRAWIMTTRFTDSELSVALYVGKYRGLDTRVILTTDPEGDPLSRLAFFRSRSIATQVLPSEAQTDYSWVLIDDELFATSAPLVPDHSASVKLQQQPVANHGNLVAKFSRIPRLPFQLAKSKTPAPQVKVPTFPNPESEPVFKPYVYDRRKKDSPVAGMPNRLPRKLKTAR